MVPAGGKGHVFTLDPDHAGIETFDDPGRDRLVASLDGGRRTPGPAPRPYRYIWPSELDLMARLADFRPEHRWAGWNRTRYGTLYFGGVEAAATPALHDQSGDFVQVRRSCRVVSAPIRHIRAKALRVGG